MAKRAYKWVWTARIKPETLDGLQELSTGLGFVVEAPGGFQGNPSPPAMLDALATAYKRDPGGVKLAFKALGIIPVGEATHNSENTTDSTAE